MESKAVSHPCLPALQHASLEATTISHILCVLLEKFSAFPSIYLTWWHLRVTNFRYCTLIQKRNLWHKSRAGKVSTTAYVRKTQVLVDSYFSMNQLWSDCQKKLGKPGRWLVSEATNCKQQQMSSITCVHLLASVLGAGGHSSDRVSHCPGPCRGCLLGDKGSNWVTSLCSELSRTCGSPVYCSGQLPSLGTLTNYSLCRRVCAEGWGNLMPCHLREGSGHWRCLFREARQKLT